MHRAPQVEKIIQHISDKRKEVRGMTSNLEMRLWGGLARLPFGITRK